MARYTYSRIDHITFIDTTTLNQMPWETPIDRLLIKGLVRRKCLSDRDGVFVLSRSQQKLGFLKRSLYREMISSARFSLI